MPTLSQKESIAKLPQHELKESLREFLQPLTELLPDVRLPAVAALTVQGILSSESPIITQIARGVAHSEQTIWPSSKRVYRFMSNPHFSYRTLRKGVYRIAQAAVAAQAPAYLVCAVDPVNFEKPYTKALEGVSTVHKSTPPALNGEARLARGYPAITATLVNLKQPAVTYAHWFSYRTADFLSQNHEVHCAIPGHKSPIPRV